MNRNGRPRSPGKEVLLTRNRIGVIPSGERTPDGEKTIALKILSKPDDLSYAAQFNLRGDADLKKGDRLRLSFWIRGSEPGDVQLNIIQDGKPWKGLSNRSIHSFRVRKEWTKILHEITVDREIREKIRVPMFMLGRYPLNAVLHLGPVRLERVVHHLPLALNSQWMLYPGVGADAVDWNAWRTADALPAQIGGSRGIPVTLKNSFLDLEPLAGRAKEGKSALLLNRFEAGAEGVMQIGIGADWWFDFLVNGASVYDTLKTGNMVHPFHESNHVFNFPVRRGTNLAALVVRSGSSGWKFFCGAVPFREKTGNIVKIVRSPEWRPVKMDPVAMGLCSGEADSDAGGQSRERLWIFPDFSQGRRPSGNWAGLLSMRRGNWRMKRIRRERSASGVSPWRRGSWQNHLYAMSKEENRSVCGGDPSAGFNLIRVHYPDGSLTGTERVSESAGRAWKCSSSAAHGRISRSTRRSRTAGIILSPVFGKRNIYLFPDIVSARTAWTAATVDFDFKTGMLFREDYRDNWRAGFHYMMKHVNAYTGTGCLMIRWSSDSPF